MRFRPWRALDAADRHLLRLLTRRERRSLELLMAFVQASAATLEVPNNLWAVCRLERPVVGERVLGALNANNDALLVPLSDDYAAELRAVRPASDPR